MKRLLSVALALLCVLAAGCGDSESPSQAGNHAPEIRGVTASPNPLPSTRTVNHYVDLTCIATDADGDSLSYYWSCAEGRFQGDRESSSAKWEPSGAGEYVIRVTVSDGREVDSDSASVTVN